MTPGVGRELVLATRNGGKIRELKPMVRAFGFEPLSLDDLGIGEAADEEGVEAFDTFEENARAKALWFAQRAGGRLVLADDSGLSVDALGGAPGVRSRRWAWAPGLTGRALDEANNARLVAELGPGMPRGARYACVVAIAGPGVDVTARGECAGVIVAEARGSAGFGYDPFFLSDELGATFGEASVEAKEGISHRGRAVRAALETLRARERIAR